MCDANEQMSKEHGDDIYPTRLICRTYYDIDGNICTHPNNRLEGNRNSCRSKYCPLTDDQILSDGLDGLNQDIYLR